MRMVFIFVLVALASASALAAQTPLTANTLTLDDPAKMPSASVEEFAWMGGHWMGEFLGGMAEEVWTPPLGGSMLGTFKLVRSDTASLYEIMALVEENGSVVLKLKHFNPDLSGWEEKDEHVAFPLVKLEENAAYFDGLTFQRISDDTLQGYLVMKTAEGVNEASFTYRLVD